MAWNTDAYRDLQKQFADRPVWAAIVPQGAMLPEGITIDSDMALIIPPEMPTVYVAFKIGPEKTHTNPKIKVIEWKRSDPS